MCLEKVKEVYEVPSTFITDGWKSFSRGSVSGKLSFEQFSVNGTREVPMDKWIQADGSQTKNGQIQSSDGSTYMAGFHVFSEESEVKKDTAKMTRVFVRKVSCSGIDRGKKAVIAQEIFVPSDPNGWPPQESDEPTPKKGLMSRLKKNIT
jgi:hypothetical protein